MDQQIEGYASPTPAWEATLLDLATQAPSNPTALAGADLCTLSHEDAYQQCAAITRDNSRTFAMAAGLLPVLKRRAVHALYAVCRISDDLVDQPSSEHPAEHLEQWRSLVTSELALNGSAASRSEQAVSLAWHNTVRAFGVPQHYVEQMIDGLAGDLQHARYPTFDDLTRYCYAVACTVGLMSMHIVGFDGPQALPYAIRLGVALQLTNILRDVGEDWRAGRLYLPLDELDAFGVSLDQIDRGQVDARWRAFMRFQIQRTRQLYAASLPGIAYLNRDGRFAIAAAGQLYAAILDQIEANDSNVFTRRAFVSTWGKVRRLPAIWWQAAH